MCSQFFCPICQQLQLKLVFEGHSPGLAWRETAKQRAKENVRHKENSEDEGKWKDLRTREKEQSFTSLGNVETRPSPLDSLNFKTSIHVLEITNTEK